MKLVVLGQSLSSSWGHGHATTWRALLKSLAARGHDVLFLERDAPQDRERRDLAEPDWCDLVFYGSLSQLATHAEAVAAAHAVIVGTNVLQGVEVGRWVQETARGVTAFYDLDTPVTLAKLERGDEEYVSAELIAGYDIYFSSTGGPTLERIEREFGAPSARALYCSVDADAYRPKVRTPLWDLGFIGAYSDDRQRTLERLLIEPARRAPQLKFVVAGQQYPADIQWPDNVQRIEHVGPDQHPAFYAGCRFTLNVTRAEMTRAGFSPSAQLFEAAACGAPIISDAWPGLSALFAPGREIQIVKSSDDVLELLQNLPEPARLQMADTARRRVLAHHTADHRAEQLEDILTDRIEKRARSRPALASAGSWAGK